MDFRVGVGYDIHRLVKGRKLFLGGLQVPYVKGLLGHSDADCLLHAICDALLGALGAGDIGELFPDTEPKYRGISSVELLKIVSDKVKASGFLINNIDAIVIAEEPKLSPFKKQMEEKISQALGLKTGSVNIKAKTNEGLADTGNRKAIACFAQAALTREE